MNDVPNVEALPSTEPVPEEPKLPAKTQDQILVEKGGVQPANVQQMHRLATAYFKAGMVPKSYKTPEQVFAGMQFAAELGLPMLSGIRQIAIVNGQPSLWGDLPLALVRASGQLEFINEFLVTSDYKTISFENKNLDAVAWASVCRVKRKGFDDIIERVFSMDDAKKAGLLSRDNVWQTYPRRMLQMKSRSQALKDTFPDILMGAAIAEYDYDTLPEAREVSPQASVQSQIVANLKGEVKQ